jgi:hypothetical protein
MVILSTAPIAPATERDAALATPADAHASLYNMNSL